jgi:hypothetical protein
VPWSVASLAASAALVLEARTERAEWDAHTASSPLIAWIRAQPAERDMFSNWGAVLYRYADRPSREVPIVDDPALESLLARRLRETSAYLVNFAERDPVWMLPPGHRYVDPDTLAARLGMRVVERFPEGTVYALPADAGAPDTVRASDR